MVRWYPTYAHWNGVQKHYWNVSTLKSVVLVAYVVLIIVESRLLHRWFRNETRQFTVSSAPWHFWSRTGLYLVIDAVYSIGMALFAWKQWWHPALALVTSILMAGVWLAGFSLNVFVVYCNEYYFPQMDEWSRIAYGEAALQAVIAFCYLGMLGFAVKAVREWRKKKQGMGEDRRVGGIALEESGQAKPRPSQSNSV